MTIVYIYIIFDRTFNDRTVSQKYIMKKSRNEIQRQERKQQIVDVALELFSKNGFHGVSVNQIAKTCGISKGLMYNYFESKDALLDFILTDYAKDIYKELDVNQDGRLSKEEFQHFVRTIYTMVKENPKYYKLIFSLSFQENVAANLAAMAAKMVPLNVDLLQEYFRKLGRKDPQGEVLYFASTLKGLLLQVVMVAEFPGMESFLEKYDELKERLIEDYS